MLWKWFYCYEIWHIHSSSYSKCFNSKIALNSKFRHLYSNLGGTSYRLSPHLLNRQVIRIAESVVSRLDLSAAFNTTDHDRDILITRLSFCFSTHGSVLSWIKSYLSSRCFLVKYENNLSSWYTSSCGVTQGSVLSTLISSCSINHHLYADYTQLFLSFHPIDFDASKDHLQNALNRISSWMTANLLTLSSSKTEFLFTGLSNQLANIHNHSNPTVSALVKNIRAHRIQAHLTYLQSFHNHPTFISA